jgi:hypothetical protein
MEEGRVSVPRGDGDLGRGIGISIGVARLSVEHRASSIERDRRPRQRLVAGGGVPSISLGHRERRGHVGQVGGPNPAGADLTRRWDGPRTPNGPAESRGAEGRVLRRESGRRRTGVRRVTCPGSCGPASMGGLRAPAWAAGAEVGEDPVDHRRLRDERDDPHRAVAGGTREGGDLEDRLEQRRPPETRLGGSESGRGDDGGWPLRGSGRRRVPHATEAVGVLAVMPRRDVALVADDAQRGDGVVHLRPGGAFRASAARGRARTPGCVCARWPQRRGYLSRLCQQTTRTSMCWRSTGDSVGRQRR